MGAASVLLADTATVLGPRFADAVVICGSHGATYPGGLVVQAGCRAAIFHDAGIGKDAAGVASLALLEDLGLPAAAVDYRSARIGDAEDMRSRGVISRANTPAAALGCRVGESVVACAERMAHARPSRSPSPEIAERRVRVAQRGQLIAWALDSASQVNADDADAIIVTGSHGGLVGGRPSAALKTAARLAIFNDAGIGADRAGIGRLAALAERGVPAATVSAGSARIGDGVSTYEEGVISFVNGPAEALGGRAGQSARDLVTAILNRASREPAK